MLVYLTQASSCSIWKSTRAVTTMMNWRVWMSFVYSTRMFRQMPNSMLLGFVKMPDVLGIALIRELGPVLWAFCRSRSLWLNAGMQFLVNIGWAFLITWLPTYLRRWTLLGLLCYAIGWALEPHAPSTLAMPFFFVFVAIWLRSTGCSPSLESTRAGSRMARIVPTTNRRAA